MENRTVNAGTAEDNIKMCHWLWTTELNRTGKDSVFSREILCWRCWL